jgi:hypothetical protein
MSDGNPQFTIWSFAYITDLRSQVERDFDPPAGQDDQRQIPANTNAD